MALSKFNRNIKKFICFCFVGGASALIDLSFFNLFFWLGITFILCRIFAIGISMIFNFTINRNITFSAKGRAIHYQIVKYLIVYAVSIGVNLLTSLIVIMILGENTLNANIAAVSGILVGIPISFFGSLLWTFKK